MMVGLTGGVGSGKSTVAGLLAGHGAVVIDADAIAREVVEPGTPGLAAVVAHFGDGVLGADGALERPTLAARIFGDDDERAALNAIVHPLVGERVGELAATAPPGSIVVYDVPLLVESGMAEGFDVVVVVLAAVDTRVRRLEGRGMGRDDALARIAAQATDEQRRAVADELVDNDGGLEKLTRQVDAVWARLTARPAPTGEGAV